MSASREPYVHTPRLARTVTTTDQLKKFNDDFTKKFGDLPSAVNSSSESNIPSYNRILDRLRSNTYLKKEKEEKLGLLMNEVHYLFSQHGCQFSDVEKMWEGSFTPEDQVNLIHLVKEKNKLPLQAFIELLTAKKIKELQGLQGAVKDSKSAPIMPQASIIPSEEKNLNPTKQPESPLSVENSSDLRSSRSTKRPGNDYRSLCEFAQENKGLLPKHYYRENHHHFHQENGIVF